MGICNTGFADCNNSPLDGCEVDTAIDLNNCGSCGNVCTFTNARAICNTGTCIMGACNIGFADCNGDPSDGCEVNTRSLTNISTDINSCGICKYVCSFPNASATCNTGACIMSTCNTGFADCNRNPADGCEINLVIDPTNCGSCVKTCSFSNASATCSSGTCTMGICNTGFTDCNKDSSDGCEVNTAANLTNCGICNNICSFANAQPLCNSGTCVMGACNTGFTDCNKDLTDGCEINTAADLNNCGTCGTACSFANAPATCNNGKCTMGTCNIGFVDCNGDSSDGCEVNTRGLTNIGTDINNCGICKYVCSFANAPALCSTGACTMGPCNAGFADCNKNPSDGCETNTAIDLLNCGTCAKICSYSNAPATCSSGTCVMGTCNTGFTDCNKDSSDGCEVNTVTSITNCGTCNNICSFANAQPLCNSGTCVMGACNTGFTDCNKDPTDGCEINTAADLNNCGTCGTACSFANAPATCSNGKCTMGTCNIGYTDCNGDPSDGCEVNTRGQTNIGTDINNCGICKYVCSFPNAPALCSTGTCTMGTCNTGFTDCNRNPSDGCETNTAIDLLNCGSCARICSFSNAPATCSSGTCTMGTCNTGFTDCNSSPTDGCEVNTAASITNCGTCNNVCSYPNAVPICQSGTCAMSSCNAGYSDCNGDPSDGCEVNTVGQTYIGTDINHCGTCQIVCAFANARALCINGACTMGTCNIGYADCNGDPSDGCEVNTRSLTNIGTDINNCGICRYVCSFPNAPATCNTGSCIMGICNTGFADCNKNPSDGCEINTVTDVFNCGRCANICSLPNAQPTCSSSACAVNTCNAGYTDCNNSPTDGCEIHTSADVTNCGTCNNICSFANAPASCTSGSCTMGTCNTGFLDCNTNPSDGCEINPATDSNHCGTCTNVCTFTNAQPLCSSGTCTMGTCNIGYKNCDNIASNGCESFSATDVNNCGTCAHACTYAHATPICSSGTCSMGACASGYADCNNSPTDGCEVQLSSDVNHCGTCTTVCSFANAAATCNNGACVMGSCNTGFLDCDSSPLNGCETNKLTDPTHCGLCTTVCNLPQTSQQCTNGNCVVGTCNVGYKDCDSTASNGCEKNTATDVNNCGTCSHACTYAQATPICSSGTCSMGACASGYGDCDNSASTGCETQTTANVNHCGTCTTVCSFANAAATCVNSVCTMGACNTGFLDCDNSPLNGCETNKLTDPTHCGLCSTVCNLPQTSQQCTNGICVVGTCTGGYANCDNTASNGCESISATDVNNCGTCSHACTYAQATPICSSGACSMGACAAGYTDCNNSPTDGCEIQTTANVNHCGTCTTVCSFANAAATCNNGACVMGSCNTGFLDCDNSPLNGCETNKLTDPTHCGLCTTVCNLPQTSQQCTNGNCVVGTCTAGYANCDNIASNGCEKNSATDVNNCGTCSHACTYAQATPICSSGTCSMGACAAGYTDCNNSPTDGCEIQTTANVNHCGTCTTVCSFANAAATCVNSVCTMGACNTGFLDCDNSPLNGCETNKLTDPTHCGLCATVCNLAQTSQQCTNGICVVGTCNAGYKDCDNTASNGCEKNTATDVNNCGTCKHVCSLSQATPGCSSGACVISSCNTGYSDCDHNAANGCEVNILTTATNCGSCSGYCTYSNAAAGCAAGACTLGACNTGYTDCNKVSSDGCEVNTYGDTNNCGKCGTVCSLPQTTATCTTGACTVGTCTAGYANCDNIASNGCESIPATDVNNCGTCTHACTYAHATPICSSGTCSMGACAAGYTDCNSSPTDGCEVQLSSDVNHCGTCTTVCSFANAAATCNNGVCTMGACNSGFGDCNSDPSDGCETGIVTNMNNCGACKSVCSLPQATATCSNSICTLSGCNTGYANCDNIASNGCEINTAGDTANCGGCKEVCQYLFATALCNSGTCSMGGCLNGNNDCDGSTTPGCESDPTADTKNCGGCNTVCSYTNAAANCTKGVCMLAGCNSGTGDCNNNLSDGCETGISADVNNCGACGTICNLPQATATCAASACAIGSCNAGYKDCDSTPGNGCEKNTATDVNNCGTCAHVCTYAHATPLCSSGTCSMGACASGYADCNNSPTDGCETLTTTNVNHCGTCATACLFANAAATCVNSVCTMGACNAGFLDCDNSPSNGCETNKLTDPTHCGLCATVCNLPHTSQQCTSGSCVVGTCTAGYANCDNTASNGCESISATDLLNCGGCGTVCSYAHATPLCSSGTCSMGACATGYTDCNNSPTDGCEVQLSSDANHCGTCTTVCSFANAVPICNSGVCAIGSCNSGYSNCNSVSSDGCEININTDSVNCGSCNSGCRFANAVPTCTNAKCVMGACNSGYLDCNNNDDDGCEFNGGTCSSG
ncbi:unnamed protein product [Adineta steineri]|uniref:Uncharacterized protein n=1 Tax=Adineta steineri TaxID=433720 RepID=A0A818XUJ3_9BILA|nr:unnamed protein product [Adineta steineri]CAF3744442.1 unnamed protein product [Adineta steineri]